MCLGAFAALSAAAGVNAQIAGVKFQIVSIDNTWRVPSNDPNFDPSEWVTYDVLMVGGFPPDRLDAVGLRWTPAMGQIFKHPEGRLLRVTPLEIEKTPSLRFDTVVDMSDAMLSSLISFGSITSAQANAICAVNHPIPGPTLGPKVMRRIARLTGSPSAFSPTPQLTFTLSSAPAVQYNVGYPLMSESVQIRETGDQYDNTLTLRLTGYAFYGTPPSHFLPASRVQAVRSLTPGWRATRSFLCGQHGVTLTGSTPYPPSPPYPPVSVEIEMVTSASGREERYLNTVNGDFGYVIGGYFAPAAAPFPGDADDDGYVSFTDLNIILAQFSQTASYCPLQADLDGNGTVDFADLNRVLTNFGRREQP